MEQLICSPAAPGNQEAEKKTDQVAVEGGTKMQGRAEDAGKKCVDMTESACSSVKRAG